MSNGTKILIAMLIIAAISIGIAGAINSTVDKEKNDTKEGELDEILEYINEADDKQINTEVNNALENDAIEENSTENKIEEDNVLGKEEDESNKQNTEAQDKQKAIQMAKDEWDISVDSYDFQATLKSEGIYEVTVISNDSNRTTVAIYTVDVNAGTVTE